MMHARCRKSLIWIVPFLVMGIVGWGGARRAEAKASEDLDLSWLQDDACAADTVVAELDSPAWEADAMSAPAAGDKAGGCRANGQCKGGKQYCSKAVGDCKGKGECKPKPEVCPLIFKPVCGCNNKTYSNECFAAMAGVNVKAEGACKTPKGEENTCKTNKDCKTAGDFCAKDTGKCEDAGVCAAKPQICPTIVAPVCGCNNKTYNNNCEAHRAGVNVKHDGKCEK
jgi:Kazal-type serine protease inhibitor domain